MICKELMAFKIFQELHISKSTDEEEEDYEIKEEEWKCLFIRKRKKKSLYNLVYHFNNIVEEISKRIKDHYGPLTTYHWKTALLTKMDESQGWTESSESDLYDIVRELIEFVQESIKTKTMNNYFLPNMNLYYKFTTEEEKGQFERSQKLLTEILEDFPRTIKALVFFKNYNVNFEGEGKRYHLFSYKIPNFNEFYQMIDSVPHILLLEGYYTFLISLFNCELKEPSRKLTNTINNSFDIHIKHTYFLVRIADHIGFLDKSDSQHLVNLNVGYKSLINNILNAFPLARFISNLKNPIHEYEMLLHFFEAPEKDECIPVLFLKQTSLIAKLHALSIHFSAKTPATTLKNSVTEFFTLDGRVDIDRLVNHLRSTYANDKYHLISKKVLEYLNEYNFLVQEPMLIEWLTPEKSKSCFGYPLCQVLYSGLLPKPPILSDLLSTPLDLFLRILRLRLETENKKWMEMEESVRNELLCIESLSS